MFLIRWQLGRTALSFWERCINLKIHQYEKLARARPKNKFARCVVGRKVALMTLKIFCTHFLSDVHKITVSVLIQKLFCVRLHLILVRNCSVLDYP